MIFEREPIHYRPLGGGFWFFLAFLRGIKHTLKGIYLSTKTAKIVLAVFVSTLCDTISLITNDFHEVCPLFKHG